MPNRQHGQSLLEVTISLGVAVVVVGALAIVTISGLKNAQFAQNQTTATKLAQDWMEQIRVIRDRNGSYCAGNAQPYTWTALWTTTCGAGSSTCYNFSVNESTTSCNGTPMTAPSLTLQAADYSAVDPNYPQFKKQLTIVDSPVSNQKTVTVTVSWTDSAGTHQSNLVTYLTPQQ